MKRVAVLLLMIMLVTSTVSFADNFQGREPPEPPCNFAGYLNDGNAPEGVFITAEVDGVVYGYAQSTVYEGKTVYALDVVADDPETEEKDGAEEGDIVLFRANGLLCNESHEWTKGGSITLNLTFDATKVPKANYSQSESFESSFGGWVKGNNTNEWRIRRTSERAYDAEYSLNLTLLSGKAWIFRAFWIDEGLDFNATLEFQLYSETDQGEVISYIGFEIPDAKDLVSLGGVAAGEWNSYSFEKTLSSYSRTQFFVGVGVKSVNEGMTCYIDYVKVSVGREGEIDLALKNLTFYREKDKHVTENPIENENTTVTVEVFNEGEGIARNINIRFYDSEFLIQELNISEISSFGSVNVSIIWVGNEGEHEFRVLVDEYDEIAEIDESNNELVSTVYVKPKDPEFEPFIVYGHVYYPDFAPVENATVNITNMRTRESLSVRTDEYGKYQGFLNDMSGSYYEGDLIEITVTNGTVFEKQQFYAYSEDGGFMANFILRIVYGVELTASSYTYFVIVNRSYIVEFSLTNKGNVVDIFSLTFEGENWTVAEDIESQYSLFPGEDVQISYNITVPNETLKGDYTLNITALSASNSSISDSITLIFKVFIEYGIEVTPDSNEKYVMPGGSVKYLIEIRNTGNILENITLSNSNPPEGWNVNLNESFLQIEPNCTVSVAFEVSAPLNAIAYEKAVIELIAVINNTSFFCNITLRTMVAEHLSWKLNTTEIDVEIEHGSSKQVSISISNTGNAPLTFKIIRAGNGSDWLSFEDDEFSLQGFKERAFPFIINVPEFTPPTFYEPYLVVNCLNLSDERKVLINITVPFTARFEIEDVPTKIGEPGEKVVYNLTIINRGNDVDSFILSYSGVWSVLLNNATPELNINEHFTVQVSIQIPDYELADAVHSTEIKVSSARDKSVWRGLTILTKVKPVFYFNVSCPEQSKEIRQGSKAVYKIKITSLSNTAQNFTIGLKGRADWASIESKNITLNAWENVTLNLTVKVPKETMKGDYKITVEVFGAFESKNLTVTVMVPEKGFNILFYLAMTTIAFIIGLAIYIWWKKKT